MRKPWLQQVAASPVATPDELSAFLEASRAANEPTDLPSRLETILDAALRLLGGDEGSIQLIDDTGGVLEIAAAIGIPEDVVRRSRVPVGQGVSGHVAATGKALLLPSAVDEVLRFASPVQMVPRRAVQAIELHGQTVAANQLAVCWLGAANRDEEVFANPEQFDIGRENNHHISFGFGPHYCLGANLARLEARVALATLLARTRSFEHAGGDPLPLHPSIVFRGVTSLPVRLVPV